jgi:hypothetical protein
MLVEDFDPSLGGGDISKIFEKRLTQRELARFKTIWTKQLVEKIGKYAVKTTPVSIGYTVTTELLSFIRNFNPLGVKTAKHLARRQLLKNQIKRASEQIRRNFKGPNFGKDSLKPIVNVKSDSVVQAFNRTEQFLKKDFPKKVNTKAFFLSLRAYRLTEKVSRLIIKQQLMEASSTDPNLTVGEVLALQELREKGLKLSPKQLKKYAKTFINKRVRSAGYLSVGWLYPNKRLAPYAQKSISPVAMRGKSRNGDTRPCFPAESMVYKTSIWTNVKTENSKAKSVVELGALAALATERGSYIKDVRDSLQQASRVFANQG